MSKLSYFKTLGVSYDELEELTDSNPSLKGMITGYVAEMMLKKMHFSDTSIVSSVIKPDDHDRLNKGDLHVNYKNKAFKIECKSLSTRTIKKSEDGVYSAKYQCDASDNRMITLPSGYKIKTSCLLIGEFDILAINLFNFESKWNFAFVLNSDLPRTKNKNYSETDRLNLLSTSNLITLPLQSPYTHNPFELMDKLLK